MKKTFKKIDDLVTESERFLSAHESETLCKSEPFPLIANFSTNERGRKLHKAHSVEPDKNATNDHYRSQCVDNSKSSHTGSFNDQSFMHKNMNGKPGTKYVHNYKNTRKLAKSNIRCYKCSGFGHVASSCSSEFTASFSSVFNWREKKDFPLNKPESLNAFSSLCSSNEHHIYNGLLGQENPKPIRVLRDTGSMVHAIHKDYVQDHEYLSDSVSLITFGGNKEVFPLARIYVDTPFIKGFIIACVIENYPSNLKLYDVLIGNGTTPCSKQICLPTPDVIESWDIDHKHFFNHDCDVNVCTNDIERANVPDTIDVQLPMSLLHSNQVTTRAQAKVIDPTILSNQKLLNFDISDEEFSALQKNDPSLHRYFKHTISDDKVEDSLNHKRNSFVLKNGKLVRLSKSKDEVITQLVVPTILRNRILSLSHDTPICAHGGRNKTYFVLSQSFFWPGMYRDVKAFCKSCDTCQRTTQKGRNVKAPLQTPDSNNPRICLRPFEKIAIDIIGELPMSRHKNRFILTVIDYATRWTEAIPLKHYDIITISKALCTIFALFTCFFTIFALCTLLAPLSDIIVKGRPDKVQWTDKCQNAIAISQNNNPVLILPNMTKTFYVQTDASNIGIGAALLQEHDDDLRPCMFVSRKLLARERNYATVEKECLSIVWALSKLSRFLLGSKFIIMTDHKALQFLRSAKAKNSRLFRWTLTLEQFNYNLEYLPGKDNMLADFLSRNFSI